MSSPLLIASPNAVAVQGHFKKGIGAEEQTSPTTRDNPRPAHGNKRPPRNRISDKLETYLHVALSGSNGISPTPLRLCRRGAALSAGLAHTSGPGLKAEAI